jgi:DNA-binding transcriptional LysR family regulator
LIADDAELVIQGALQGLGLAYVAEHDAPHLADGRLLRVLQDWCQPFRDFHRLPQPATANCRIFTALVNVLRVG